MKSLIRLSVLVSCVLAPSLAFAQARKPTPTPTPTPNIFAAPTPEATPASSNATDDGERRRVGVGAGWTFPADLTTPNTVSVRFRMASGLTIEPVASIAASGTFNHTHLTSANNATAADRTAAQTLFGGMQVRKPVAHRGPIEYHFIIIPGFSLSNSVNNPEGTDNRIRTTSMAMGIGWGLGVEYFPPKFEGHWSLSMDATNPLFAFAYATTHDESANTRTNTSSYGLGATFAPTVRGMLHLYY